MPVNDPMPLATCPLCGNSEDRSIYIEAKCIAVVEGDQYTYFDCHFRDEFAMATCKKCGHHTSLRNFELGVLPLRSEELEGLQQFLQQIADQYKGMAGEFRANRCLGLLRQLATSQTLAPADAGD